MKRIINAFFLPYALLLFGLGFAVIEMCAKGYYELWYSILTPFALAFLVSFLAEKTNLFFLHFLSGAFLGGMVGVFLVFPHYTSIGMIVGVVLIWACAITRIVFRDKIKIVN